MNTELTILPPRVCGYISPYPTVVSVTIENHNASHKFLIGESWLTASKNTNTKSNPINY